jgi:predicted HTH transcriptional regulator
MTGESLKELINRYSRENEWIEFKVNNKNFEMIGEYISALSNSATLNDVSKAYLIYGVNDETLEMVGTKFYPKEDKKGEVELESWLYQMLEPNVEFQIHHVDCEGLHFAVFEINCAKHRPISFSGQEYIRIGSSKRKLKSYPEKERRLWSKFSSFCFEEEIAKSSLQTTDILSLLDYKGFFRLIGLPYEESMSTEEYIVQKLIEYDLVAVNKETLSIRNLGAILFAHDLNNFPALDRKKMRVIKYRGNGKIETEFEQEGRKGYAIAFQDLVKYIMGKLPHNEIIKDALREVHSLYPEIALRELIANALIHQDFSIGGTNPMIEIFDNRIEISNSGRPLIDVLRLIDYQPKSRNEKLANLMRLMGICEERGSGIDKVINAIEIFQLPAPKFIAEEDFFKVILFAPLNFEDMDKNDRIRATYQHCTLKFLKQEPMNNTTLRERFGLIKKEHSKASKAISDTLEKGLIKPADPENKSTKHIKYIPFYG